MTAPFLYSPTQANWFSSVGGPGGGAVVVNLPDGREIGDLILVHFLRNGVVGSPGSNWTLVPASPDDNANTYAYARVDGTTITTGNGGTVTFPDGGSLITYCFNITLVRGAVPYGDPFDSGVQFANGYGATSAWFSRTTTGPDRRLLLSVNNYYGYEVTAMTSPLATWYPWTTHGHMASGVQAAAGATGNQYFSYGVNISTWGMFGALKPAKELIIAGVKKPITRHRTSVGGVLKEVSDRSTVVGGAKKTL